MALHVATEYFERNGLLLMREWLPAHDAARVVGQVDEKVTSFWSASGNIALRELHDVRNGMPRKLANFFNFLDLLLLTLCLIACRNLLFLLFL